jgi:hypothetical protein
VGDSSSSPTSLSWNVIVEIFGGRIAKFPNFRWKLPKAPAGLAEFILLLLLLYPFEYGRVSMISMDAVAMMTARLISNATMTCTNLHSTMM